MDVYGKRQNAQKYEPDLKLAEIASNSNQKSYIKLAIFRNYKNVVVNALPFVNHKTAWPLDITFCFLCFPCPPFLRPMIVFCPLFNLPFTFCVVLFMTIPKERFCGIQLVVSRAHKTTNQQQQQQKVAQKHKK